MTTIAPPRELAPRRTRRTHRRRRRSLHIRAPLMAMFVLGALCTLVAAYILHTGADQTTAGTLLVFGPRRFVPVAWLIGAVVMIALGWRWVLASLGMAVFSLFALSGFSVPKPGAAASAATAVPERTLKLVSFNVDDGRDSDFLFQQAVPRWNADILLFQACGERVGMALQRGVGDAARVLKVGEFCIASRFPIVRGRLIPINPPQISGRQAYAVHVRVLVARDTVSVVGVHLASPRTELAAALGFDFTQLQNSTRTRSQQAERLSQYLRGIREPLVVAGDFNTLQESQIYKHYFGSYTDAFRATNWGFGHTMQAGVHRLRIDHVLTGSGMRPVALTTEWNWPTEHRPLVATLTF